jgi:hypothetical protein
MLAAAYLSTRHAKEIFSEEADTLAQPKAILQTLEQALLTQQVVHSSVLTRSI